MEYDTDAARAALEAAFDSQESVGEQAQPLSDQSVPSEVEQPRATEPDTFSSIDPNTLAPELQVLYKQMQGDYTRKTQEVSEQRRAYESFGGLDEVRNAVEFVHALRDPNNLVQLHSELSEYLQSQGLTKAEADASASTAIESNRQEDEWGLSDPDDEIRRELQALKAQNEELVTWKQELEDQRRVAEIEQTIARQETHIRNANPQYKDQDVDAIYVMSYAFGGDLIQAQKAYEAERQRIFSDYMASKGSVPSSLGPITPSGGAQVPETFGRDLDAAHDYAKRRAIAELAQMD